MIKEKANQVEDNQGPSYCFMTQEFTEDNTVEIFAAACLEKTLKNKAHSWILDSGATSHMVNSKEFFTDLKLQPKGYVRLTDNDKFLEVQGIGSGTINCIVGEEKTNGLKINNVLYVPKLGTNLLSVKKIVKDGYSVHFTENGCCVTQNGETRAIGNLSSELYELKSVGISCVSKDLAGYCQHMLPRRFGHRDLSAIRN